MIFESNVFYDFNVKTDIIDRILDTSTLFIHCKHFKFSRIFSNKRLIFVFLLI